MKIRKAAKSDIPDIVQLNSFVQKIHAEEHPEIFKSSTDEKELTLFFEGILEKKNNLILFASKEDQALGYLWATFKYSPENPFKHGRKQVYIHQVSVHEDYRNQNIGSSLFSALETIAEENGIQDFALDSWVFNDGAHKFFEKLGFATYNINMWKK